MTNLEAIKEDFKIGDPIRIACGLGIKEGYIIDIKEDRIKLRPFDTGRKPISIAVDNISAFEEALLTSESANLDSGNQPPQSVNSINTSESSKKNDDNNETIIREGNQTEPEDLLTSNDGHNDYEKALDDCKTQLKNILSFIGINLSESLPTNATVKKINDIATEFGTAVSDSGDVLLIQEEGFVGNPEVLQNEGARLFCRPIQGNSPQKCYVTISELTYGELNDFYEECINNHIVVRAISIVKTLRSLSEFQKARPLLKSLYNILKKATRYYYRETLEEIESPSDEIESHIADYIEHCINNESSERPLKDEQIRNSYAYKYRIKVPVDVISVVREKLGILPEEYRTKPKSCIQNYDDVLAAINSLNSRFNIDQTSLLNHLVYISTELQEVETNVSVTNAIVKKVNKNNCIVCYQNYDLRCFYNSVLDFDLLERMSQNPNEEIPVRALTFFKKNTLDVKISNIVADCTIQEHINKIIHFVKQGNYVYARRYFTNVRKTISRYLTSNGKKHLNTISNVLSNVSFQITDLPIISINYSAKVQAEQEGSKNVALAIIRETDKLIEQSDVDGAIHILDNIITQNVLQPKEHALILQKKVQILTSADRTPEAINVYLEWISYGIDNNLFTAKKTSRMYVDLAKIQSSITGQEEDALDSLKKAINYNPDNKLAISFKEQILEVVETKNQQSSGLLIVDPDTKSNRIIDVVSAMLDLDIQEHKFTDKRIINNGGVPNTNIANELYQEAKQTAEVDSYPLYLESAKAFHELKYYDQQDYLFVVANYAKLKADSLLRKFRNLITSPANDILTSLHRLRDSAQSYYLESLNLWSYISFEDEEEENHETESNSYDRIVLEILVNHLVLDVACHYAELGIVNTYDFNALFHKTFKEVFFDCVKSKDDNLITIAAGTIVKIGSYNSSTWNNLVSLPNGTSGLYGMLSNEDIRKRLYVAINTIENSSFTLDVKPNNLLQSAFSKHSTDRYDFEKMIDKFREEVLSPHSMESITSKWKELNIETLSS